MDKQHTDEGRTDNGRRVARCEDIHYPCNLANPPSVVATKDNRSRQNQLTITLQKRSIIKMKIINLGENIKDR